MAAFREEFGAHINNLVAKALEMPEYNPDCIAES